MLGEIDRAICEVRLRLERSPAFLSLKQFQDPKDLELLWCGRFPQMIENLLGRLGYVKNFDKG